MESDNGETESKVHFSLPQENTDKITECYSVSYGSEIDLEKALIGNVSTDSSDNNYFCFIEGDYIHHSRTGGNAYYEIEGIKGDTEESTGSVFKMPSISKVVTDSSEYISGLKGSLSIAGVLNAEALVSKNGVSGNIQAGLGPVGIGLSRGTETHASSYSTQAFYDINGDSIPDIVQTEDGKLKIYGGSRNSNGSVTFSSQNIIENISNLSYNTTSGRVKAE